jgi:asparagine synthase (glutamine-hydrolysing)
MCGIAGWFSRQPPQDSDRALLQEMISTIAHRGPDGSGFLITGNAALAHCRLAIIDLETGQQPMTVRQGAVSIVYNGEIYNYRALRRELANAGVRFTTRSDTEVILQNYLVNGIDGFSRLRGMFALAIWDNRQRRALLVRDGIGIKPLFYHQTRDNDLVFASEAKAILAKMKTGAQLDTNALHLLLNYRYLPGDSTLFQGIRQLPPGHILSWDSRGEVTLQHYATTLIPTSGSPLELLSDSVKAHMTADVEVGAYLSGGIDSAAIVSLAREYSPIRTFTLDIGDDPQEAENAAATARLLGVKNDCNTPPAGNTEATLRSLIWHLEVPKINAFQTSEIARFAAREVKVVLSGLGGDELFLGYNLHNWLYRARLLHRLLPVPAGKLLSQAGLNCLNLFNLPPWSEAERMARVPGALGEWSSVYGLLRNIWDAPGLRQEIYGPRMLDSVLGNAHEFLEGNWVDSGDPVRDAANYEWRQKMVNDLLWQEDRSSMAYGLEVRVPFLDTALKIRMDTAATAELMPGGAKKGYMQTMLREILPPQILHRPKSGFQVNAPVFFRTHLAGLATQYLNRPAVEQYGLFNPDFVDRVLRYGPGKRYRWHFFMLYFMLMTHMWIEIFEHRAVDNIPLDREYMI